MSRNEGNYYEQIAEHVCKGLGYQVLKPAVGNQSSWDRIVNGNRLQIKKRCVDESKPNNIRLVTNLTSSQPVYDTADVDAFAIFWRDEWFVFPATAIADAQGVIRNGLYMPSVFQFKNRWDVLAGERVDVDVQGVLF
jgi:hypothetical protein